ncbi:BEN domain-containing protein 3 [Ambystoma mexicanum]|uniref:BEN domain-containing protein 3 n=1 Tax=Ambystoma mexicanum TaxID=8296 RepID=UPI0037E8CBAC
MNSIDFCNEDEGNTCLILEISHHRKRAKSSIVKVETSIDDDDVLDCSMTARTDENHDLDTSFNLLPHSNKRKQTYLVSDKASSEQEITRIKKKRLIPEGLLSNTKSRGDRSSTKTNLERGKRNSNSMALLSDGEETASENTVTSYKKPLYGISHKITEKKTPLVSEQHAPYALYDKINPCDPSPLGVIDDQHKPESVTSTVATSLVEEDSNLYSLIQKMFITLNTLNSNMSQLHSKVDLLSLEVNRIKKIVNPEDTVAEFLPPQEYQLTSSELKQLTEQSTSAGDLACLLLVQLFPELFGEDEFSRNCTACGFLSKNKLQSLHLHLIRNYVEVCYPSVRSSTVWQMECLPQVNDFFSRFWAQKEMESSQHNVQSSNLYESDQVDNSPNMDDKEQDGVLPLERSSSIDNDFALDAQDINDFLDEASSPGEFAVFLLHRLFAEIFEQSKPPERYSCYGDCESTAIDPHRLQIIRKYTEIYFPDVQEEDVWLEQCAQRINDELENIYLDNSDCDEIRDDCYDSSSLPDDLSIVKLEDGVDYDRPGRRSKKIWLVPMDFERLEIPVPDFEVPYPEYLLSKEQMKNIYESSLSIGNFASRMLVHFFPELFTPENLRKQYNCSGSLGKKQLDPFRVRLIRHYVQILYPRAKNDRVWTLEFVGKLDERCRRRDTEQRRSYQQQRKVHVPLPERTEFVGFELNPERFRELLEGPPLPPERSSKDFCKIPLDELVVTPPDFPVPSSYMLSDKEVREIVQQSLSVGNFAARLLVRLFPELFTTENLRLQYNHSGACNKKQLDPIRLRMIRHYVETVYPVDKMDEVWHYECIPSIDERCRRPNRKKCDILKKAKKSKR